MTNKYQQHQNLVNITKKAISSGVPNARVFDAHTGLFYRKPDWSKVAAILYTNLDPIQKMYKIKQLFIPIAINAAGFPDNWGFMSIEKQIPALFFMETKTGSAVLSKKQKEFKEFCNLFNIPHIVNRDESETVDTLNREYDRLKKLTLLNR